MNLKNKSLLIYDYGTFFPLAQRLAKDFGKVYYYSVWKSSFPTIDGALIGEGYSGVERILNFFDYVDKVDYFLFPDILDGDLQEYLRDMGKKVFGSGKGEELEMFRGDTKKLLKKLGLNVNHYVEIKGMDELRKYLKSHKDVYVKFDIYRGTAETFHSPNYNEIELYLDEVEHKLGIKKYIQEFIVEDALNDCVEIGYDGYCINGEYPSKTIVGIEIKGVAYMGIVKDYDKFPKEITRFNDKIAPILKKYGYAGFMSTEVRVGKDHKDYMVDFTARAGSPPSEIYQNMYENLGEIIAKGAEGVMVEPIVKYKYGGQLQMHCDALAHGQVMIDFPKEIEDNVKLRCSAKINGNTYVLPQPEGGTCLGSLVASGNSMSEVFNKLKDMSGQIHCKGIEIEMDALDKITDEIKKMKDYGINIF